MLGPGFVAIGPVCFFGPLPFRQLARGPKAFLALLKLGWLAVTSTCRSGVWESCGVCGADVVASLSCFPFLDLSLMFTVRVEQRERITFFDCSSSFKPKQYLLINIFRACFHYSSVLIDIASCTVFSLAGCGD